MDDVAPHPSLLELAHPSSLELAHPSMLELALEGRAHSTGDFTVRRVLPSEQRRLIGPFIFYDHFGPLRFEAGQGLDVRPHPHIGLATLTYLFEGEIFHRDHLGCAQAIHPGDLNWMTAGRGIVHSERTRPELRIGGSPLHGIQSWVALPRCEEEREPSFEHHPEARLPVVRRPGAVLKVIAGTAYGEHSPAPVLSPTLYVHALLEAGASLTIDDEHVERAAYVVSGALELEGRSYGAGSLLLFRPGNAEVRAPGAAQVMLLGGAPLDGERYIEWNFVSSSRERIERAKQDWRERRFPTIPGDDHEFIPLP